jgi:hypothetical protein
VPPAGIIGRQAEPGTLDLRHLCFKMITLPCQVLNARVDARGGIKQVREAQLTRAVRGITCSNPRPPMIAPAGGIGFLDTFAR